MAISLPPRDDHSADDGSADDRRPSNRRLLVAFIEKLPDLVRAAAPIIVALIMAPPF